MLHTVVGVQIPCKVDAFKPLQSLGLSSFGVKIRVEPSNLLKRAYEVCLIDIHLGKHVHHDKLLCRLASQLDGLAHYSFVLLCIRVRSCWQLLGCRVSLAHQSHKLFLEHT